MHSSNTSMQTRTFVSSFMPPLPWHRRLAKLHNGSLPHKRMLLLRPSSDRPWHRQATNLASFVGRPSLRRLDKSGQRHARDWWADQGRGPNRLETWLFCCYCCRSYHFLLLVSERPSWPACSTDVLASSVPRSKYLLVVHAELESRPSSGVTVRDCKSPQQIHRQYYSWLKIQVWVEKRPFCTYQTCCVERSP